MELFRVKVHQCEDGHVHASLELKQSDSIELCRVNAGLHEDSAVAEAFKALVKACLVEVSRIAAPEATVDLAEVAPGEPHPKMRH
jgi:hypothetical protein